MATTIREIYGDYGEGEGQQRRARVRSSAPEKHGGQTHRYHSAMQPREINLLMLRWPRVTDRELPACVSWYRFQW